MRPASALVAFHSGLVGGPLRSLEGLLGDLAEGGAVRVLVPATSEPAPDFERLGVTVSQGPFEPLVMPASALEAADALSAGRRDVRWFRAALRHSEADLAIAVTATLPAFLLAARLEHIPSIMWVAELLAGAGRGAGRELGGWALLTAEAALATAVVACSPEVALQFGPTAAVSTILPPIGDYSGGDGEGFRRQHRIASAAPCIAAVGSITRGRGQHTLIEALPRLLKHEPALRCVIEGEPFDRDADRAYDAELVELAKRLGVGEAIVRSSGTEPIADLYAAADLIVNPAGAHPESFGRVALEAGRAGTPSVLTSVGVVPSLHTDGATALLVPPEDAGAMVAAIERLLSDRALGAGLAAGAATLAGVASPERSRAAWEAVIDTVLGKKRRPQAGPAFEH